MGSRGIHVPVGEVIETLASSKQKMERLKYQERMCYIKMLEEKILTAQTKRKQKISIEFEKELRWSWGQKRINNEKEKYKSAFKEAGSMFAELEQKIHNLTRQNAEKRGITNAKRNYNKAKSAYDKALARFKNSYYGKDRTFHDNEKSALKAAANKYSFFLGGHIRLLNSL